MKHAKKKSFFNNNNIQQSKQFTFDEELEDESLTPHRTIQEPENHSPIKIIVTSIIVAVLMFIVFQMNFARLSVLGGNIYTMIVFMNIILTIGFMYAVNYLLWWRDYKLEKVFLMIIIPLGLIYSLILVPGMVPDENVHMRLTLSMSSQIMGIEGEHITLRGEENYIYNRLPKAPSIDAYNYAYSNMFSGETNGDYVEINETSCTLKQAIGYVPAVIGVTFCRLIHLGATPTFYVGRLCNFAFYVTLVYFALKKIPLGKQLLFAITLLPMVNQQMISLSYDAVLLSASFFCTAYGLFFVYQSEDVTFKDYVVYLLAALLLLNIKSAIYAFLLMIPIFAKYKGLSTNTKVERRQKLIIFLSLAIFILALNFVSFGSTHEVSNMEAAAVSHKNIISWSGTEGYTIGWILSHPFDSIVILINTLIEKGSWYMYTCLGRGLSWFSIYLDYNIFNVWGILLIVSALKKPREGREVNGLFKVLLIIIDLILLFLPILAMWTHWTPLSYTIIAGVQGRYFLPAVFTIMILLNNKYLCIPEKPYRYIHLATLGLIVVTLMNLIATCYVV